MTLGKRLHNDRLADHNVGDEIKLKVRAAIEHWGVAEWEDEEAWGVVELEERKTTDITYITSWSSVGVLLRTLAEGCRD